LDFYKKTQTKQKMQPTIYREQGFDHPEMIQLPPRSWEDSVRLLEDILQSHEEQPRVGDRYLVGRMRRYISKEGDQDGYYLTYEYILTNESPDQYSYQIVVYHNQPPFLYDYDVFEMLPISESLGLY